MYQILLYLVPFKLLCMVLLALIHASTFLGGKRLKHELLLVVTAYSYKSTFQNYSCFRHLSKGLFIYYVITCREEGGQKMTISFAYFEGYIYAYILHMQMETGEGAWVQKCLKLCLRNEWSQSTLPLNTTGPFAGLKLIKDSIKKDTNFENGITICLRFRISERMSCKESAIFFRKSCIYCPCQTKSLKLSKF